MLPVRRCACGAVAAMKMPSNTHTIIVCSSFVYLLLMLRSAVKSLFIFDSSAIASGEQPSSVKSQFESAETANSSFDTPAFRQRHTNRLAKVSTAIAACDKTNHHHVPELVRRSTRSSARDCTSPCCSLMQRNAAKSGSVQLNGQGPHSRHRQLKALSVIQFATEYLIILSKHH